MSTDIPLRENEMSFRKADELYVKVLTHDSIDLRRITLFASYF